MNFFVEFENITATGAGLLCEGSTPFKSLAIEAAADLAVFEMADVAAKAGKLRRCSVIDGVLHWAAEIWDRVAVQKIREGVYAGLALLGISTGDELTIERCALVDRPDALSKGAGQFAPIYVDEVFKMAVHNASAGPAANPYQQIKFGGLADPLAERAAEERAIALIKFAKSGEPRQAQPGHRGLFEWLQARAGR